MLLWLALGLLVAALGVIIAAFASSAWAPHVVQRVPATYAFARTPPAIR